MRKIGSAEQKSINLNVRIDEFLQYLAFPIPTAIRVKSVKNRDKINFSDLRASGHDDRTIQISTKRDS